jgi:hypothetical protein
MTGEWGGLCLFFLAIATDATLIDLFDLAFFGGNTPKNLTMNNSCVEFVSVEKHHTIGYDEEIYSAPAVVSFSPNSVIIPNAKC